VAERGVGVVEQVRRLGVDDDARGIAGAAVQRGEHAVLAVARVLRLEREHQLLRARGHGVELAAAAAIQQQRAGAAHCAEAVPAQPHRG